jgi:predicted SAM-dependent methyltransferase
VHKARTRLAARRAERQGAKRDAEILSKLAGRTDVKVNVGSSSSHLDGWINADLLRDPEGRCIRMDATRPWPFEPGSLAAVNSEHFIEHISVEDARAYFREAFAALRPGGVIRTSTPDLEGLAKAYLDDDPTLLELHREHGYEASGRGDMVNNYVYMWGHRHMFDLEKLTELMHEAGFEGVERASYGRSRHEVLDGIDRHEMGILERVVIAVDGVKPG